ncbi:MAG TPA: hypothetical protein PLJ26_00890 [Candidatus Omnitrophota bacterium]|nr:hypothetical protein [Candidatus Omnitrophota bacterium]HQJ15030.1 hypothetical protein [Candidatus Omnitrophota bacterium]
MIKKIFPFLVWSFIYASCAYAQIGTSVKAFKAGSFARAEGFTLQGSYLITEDPAFEGKYAYNFFTEDNRYRIQLIADKKGNNIVFEYLMYPFAEDPDLAMKDGSIAISFVSQASAQAVTPDEFVSLVSEANKGAPNVRYTKVIRGYTVSMTRHRTEILTGWSIGVRR